MLLFYYYLDPLLALCSKTSQLLFLAFPQPSSILNLLNQTFLWPSSALPSPSIAFAAHPAALLSCVTTCMPSLCAGSPLSILMHSSKPLKRLHVFPTHISSLCVVSLSQLLRSYCHNACLLLLSVWPSPCQIPFSLLVFFLLSCK